MKTLVTATQAWDPQRRNLLQTRADVGNVFGVVGNARVKSRRDDPYVTLERRKPLWSNRIFGGRAVPAPVGRARLAVREDEEEHGLSRWCWGGWIHSQNHRIRKTTAFAQLHCWDSPNTAPKEGADCPCSWQPLSQGAVLHRGCLHWCWMSLWALAETSCYYILLTQLSYSAKGYVLINCLSQRPSSEAVLAMLKHTTLL